VGCEEVPLEWNEFEMAAACLAMWSLCDDSVLRYNEREGTARTVQSIESEQRHTSGSGRQRPHGLTRSVRGRGATLGTSSMGMARAFSFFKKDLFWRVVPLARAQHAYLSLRRRIGHFYVGMWGCLLRDKFMTLSSYHHKFWQGRPQNIPFIIRK
jgi:hypothetical protein